MKRKAFTLIELLVVIAMVVIVGATIVGAIGKAHRHVATQSGSSSDPTQSPIPPVEAPTPATQNIYTIQFNDPQAFMFAQRTLNGVGLKVVPFSEKSSSVFDPDGISTNLHWTKMHTN